MNRANQINQITYSLINTYLLGVERLPGPPDDLDLLLRKKCVRPTSLICARFVQKF